MDTSCSISTHDESTVDIFTERTYTIQVTACLSSYMELRPCRPRTEKLKQLLAECPYRGPEFEASEDQEEVKDGSLGEGGAREVEGVQSKRRRMLKKVGMNS